MTTPLPNENQASAKNKPRNHNNVYKFEKTLQIHGSADGATNGFRKPLFRSMIGQGDNVEIAPVILNSLDNMKPTKSSSSNPNSQAEYSMLTMKMGETLKHPRAHINGNRMNPYSQPLAAKDVTAIKKDHFDYGGNGLYSRSAGSSMYAQSFSGFTEPQHQLTKPSSPAYISAITPSTLLSHLARYPSFTKAPANGRLHVQSADGSHPSHLPGEKFPPEDSDLVSAVKLSRSSNPITKTKPPIPPTKVRPASSAAYVRHHSRAAGTSDAGSSRSEARTIPDPNNLSDLLLLKNQDETLSSPQPKSSSTLYNHNASAGLFSSVKTSSATTQDHQISENSVHSVPRESKSNYDLSPRKLATLSVSEKLNKTASLKMANSAQQGKVPERRQTAMDMSSVFKENGNNFDSINQSNSELLRSTSANHDLNTGSVKSKSVIITNGNSVVMKALVPDTSMMHTHARSKSAFKSKMVVIGTEEQQEELTGRQKFTNFGLVINNVIPRARPQSASTRKIPSTVVTNRPQSTTSSPVKTTKDITTNKTASLAKQRVMTRSASTSILPAESDEAIIDKAEVMSKMQAALRRTHAIELNPKLLLEGNFQEMPVTHTLTGVYRGDTGEADVGKGQPNAKPAAKYDPSFNIRPGLTNEGFKETILNSSCDNFPTATTVPPANSSGMPESVSMLHNLTRPDRNVTASIKTTVQPEHPTAQVSTTNSEKIEHETVSLLPPTHVQLNTQQEKPPLKRPPVKIPQSHTVQDANEDDDAEEWESEDEDEEATDTIKKKTKDGAMSSPDDEEFTEGEYDTEGDMYDDIIAALDDDDYEEGGESDGESSPDPLHLVPPSPTTNRLKSASRRLQQFAQEQQKKRRSSPRQAKFRHSQSSNSIAIAADAVAAPLTQAKLLRPRSAAVCVRDALDAETQPALLPSLFPNVPPTINFVLSHQKVESLPFELRKLLKWRMSTITPNVVKSAITRSNFKPTKKPYSWLGYWGKHMKSEGFKAVREYQKVNHFPGSFQIGRKDRLWRNLSRMQVHFGKKEFNFFPHTYVLPGDLKQLKRAFDDGTSKQKWILKPCASARGIGIRLLNKFSQVPKKRPVIVQRYISNPLLVNDSKFDIRLYVYVTSYDPLRIYLYDDGLARFASVKYSSSLKSLSNRYIHLTNYSVNKKNSDYKSNEDESVCQGHKWGLKAMLTYLQQKGIDTKLVWENIKDLVIKTIIVSEPYVSSLTKANVRRRYCCHELFGFDVMLDENLKVWLIEVNISPSLHSNSPLDLNIKGGMIKDLLNMAGFMLPDRGEVKEAMSSGSDTSLSTQISDIFMDKRLYPQNFTQDEKSKHAFFTQRHNDERVLLNILSVLTPGDVRVLIETVDEDSRKGSFQRIFPTHDTQSYLRFFQQPRYYNLLLNEWMKWTQRREDQGYALLESLCARKVHLEHPTTNPKHQWTSHSTAGILPLRSQANGPRNSALLHKAVKPVDSRLSTPRVLSASGVTTGDITPTFNSGLSKENIPYESDWLT